MNDERRNDNDSVDESGGAADITRLEASAATAEELATSLAANAASADDGARGRVALARQRLKVAYDELAAYAGGSEADITDE